MYFKELIHIPEIYRALFAHKSVTFSTTLNIYINASTLSDRDSATFKMASALAFAFARIAFASPDERQKIGLENIYKPG